MRAIPPLPRAPGERGGARRMLTDGQLGVCGDEETETGSASPIMSAASSVSRFVRAAIATRHPFKHGTPTDHWAGRTRCTLRARRSHFSFRR